MENSTNTKQKFLTTRTMVSIAILSAVATLVMAFKFPLPIFPSFYKLDAAESIVLIGAFALGPVAAVIIEAIKVFLNFLVDGSVTAGIGELSNFIMGCSFVLPAAIIYNRNRTRKTAIAGSLVGVVSVLIVSSLMNYFILVPAFASAFGGMENVLKAANKVNANITDLGSLVVFAVIPFNALKAGINAIIVFLIYKRVSGLLKPREAKRSIPSV